MFPLVPIYVGMYVETELFCFCMYRLFTYNLCDPGEVQGKQLNRDNYTPGLEPAIVVIQGLIYHYSGNSSIMWKRFTAFLICRKDSQGFTLTYIHYIKHFEPILFVLLSQLGLFIV